MKHKSLLLGLFAIMVALTLNLRHTFNEYGILDNKLQVSVLAQSNSSGNGSTNFGGTTNGGGSSPSWWDKTDFFAIMTKEPIYNTQAAFELGYKFINVDFTYGSGLVLVLVTCKTSLFNTCDTTKEGIYDVKNAGFTTFG